MNEKTKYEAGWHYHNNYLSRIELGYSRPAVMQPGDLEAGQVFFISLKQSEWVPTFIKGYQNGIIQLITFKYNNKLEVEDWLEYHSLFDFSRTNGYTVSKKGAKLIAEHGYDYIHFIGEELDEGFIVNPPEQVVSVLSFKISKG